MRTECRAFHRAMKRHEQRAQAARLYDLARTIRRIRLRGPAFDNPDTAARIGALRSLAERRDLPPTYAFLCGLVGDALVRYGLPR